MIYIYIITCVRNDQKIGIDISFAIPNSGSSLSSSLTSTASSIDGTRAPSNSQTGTSLEKEAI